MGFNCLEVRVQGVWGVGFTAMDKRDARERGGKVKAEGRGYGKTST